jgi:pimeloyl-ACP methyl ester carboxylesterase
VSRPAGYTFEDLAAITAPTLILVGDRDRFVSVEERARAYRALRDGELAVLPNTPAGNTTAAVMTAIEFFERKLG